MGDQDVQYDSVADLRVAVSDDEDGEFFVADDVMEEAPRAVGFAVDIVQAGAPMGVSATPSRTSGHYVSGTATSSWSRGDVPARDPRVENVTSTGTSPSEPSGFLSTISQRFLPSFLQYGRASNAPVTMSVTTTATVRPTEAIASRAAPPATTALHGASASYQSRSVASPMQTVPAPSSGYSIFTDHPYSGPVSANSTS